MKNDFTVTPLLAKLLFSKFSIMASRYFDSEVHCIHIKYDHSIQTKVCLHIRRHYITEPQRLSEELYF
jgi:hypothetical protein